MPIISVIIPGYNVEKTIEKCIDTLLNQTFIDFELIIINDGSIDKTKEICEAYALKDSRIVVINTENRGVSMARNRGLEVCKGDFIVFADSDDYVSENYLSSLITDYEQTKVDLIIHGFNTVGFDYDVAKEMAPQIVSITDFKTLFEEYKLHKTGFLFGKLFKASILKEQAIFFDKNIVLHEDTVFILSYLEHCKEVFFNNKKEYYYVYHPNSLSRKKQRYTSIKAVYLAFLKYYFHCIDIAKLNQNSKDLVCFKDYTNGLLRTMLSTFYKSGYSKKERISMLNSLPKRGIELFKDYTYKSTVKNSVLKLLKKNKIEAFDFCMSLLYFKGTLKQWSR